MKIQKLTAGVRVNQLTSIGLITLSFFRFPLSDKTCEEDRADPNHKREDYLKQRICGHVSNCKHFQWNKHQQTSDSHRSQTDKRYQFTASIMI